MVFPLRNVILKPLTLLVDDGVIDFNLKYHHYETTVVLSGLTILMIVVVIIVAISCYIFAKLIKMLPKAHVRWRFKYEYEPDLFSKPNMTIILI